MTNEFLAKWLHDNCQQMAKDENWQTQEITKIKFEDLPKENQNTMLALADKMLDSFKIIAVQADVGRSSFLRKPKDWDLFQLLYAYFLWWVLWCISINLIVWAFS